MQGQKFDPDGKYTKKYIPELKDMPNKYSFNPWEAPKDVLESANIKLGKDYPMPIVEIGSSREKALEAGADEYDTKPIEFKRLLGKIKDFLNN